MNRALAALCLVGAFCVLPALAQSDDDSNVADRSPKQNVQPGNVQERAPGTWVQRAIAQHNGFIDERVNAPRSGQNASDQNRGASQGTTGRSGSGGSTISNLMDIAGDLMGGSFGGITSLGDLGGLSNTGGGAGGTTGTGGMSIEDLIALRDAMAEAEGAQKPLNNKAADRAQSARTYEFGGAVGRLPKADARFQDSDTPTERKFVARLLEAWADTFFTALTVGFQSTDFIDLLKDGLRPLLIPDTQDDGGDDGNGDGGSGNDGSGNGGGIEDIPDDGGNDDGGDSII